MVGPYLLFLSLVILERLNELALSRRNAAWAEARGGIEYGRSHFPVMALVHTGFFASAALEVILLRRPFLPALGATMLALALAAQALRYWAIRSLGPRWNVRVIVIPGMPLVTSGPYRHMRHPNYVAVVLEMFAIPLIHTAYLTAVVFSLLNLGILGVRIRCEEAALAPAGR
jgi:methyltransferase